MGDLQGMLQNSRYACGGSVEDLSILGKPSLVMEHPNVSLLHNGKIDEALSASLVKDFLCGWLWQESTLLFLVCAIGFVVRTRTSEEDGEAKIKTLISIN